MSPVLSPADDLQEDGEISENQSEAATATGNPASAAKGITTGVS